MKIYIAAASAEIERAERMIALARKAGFTVVHDWPAQIREAGEANPTTVAVEQRRAWALDCLARLSSADALWLLAPQGATSGAWVEFGASVSYGRYTIMSGAHQSVFAELATENADTDEDGLAMLCAYRHRKSMGY